MLRPQHRSRGRLPTATSPNQRDLLVAAYPETEHRSLLGDHPPDDVAARLDLVVGEYLRMTIDNEAALRTALRLSLELDGAQRENLLLRQGRVISWLKDALEPLVGAAVRTSDDAPGLRNQGVGRDRGAHLALRCCGFVARRGEGADDVVSPCTTANNAHDSEGGLTERGRRDGAAVDPTKPSD